MPVVRLDRWSYLVAQVKPKPAPVGWNISWFELFLKVVWRAIAICKLFSCKNVTRPCRLNKSVSNYVEVFSFCFKARCAELPWLRMKCGSCFILLSSASSFLLDFQWSLSFSLSLCPFLTIPCWLSISESFFCINYAFKSLYNLSSMVKYHRNANDCVNTICFLDKLQRRATKSNQVFGSG